VLWLQLGTLAQVVLGAGDAAAAAAATSQLRDRLKPLCCDLFPDERLMVAQILVNYHFHLQDYEQFDWLAMVVEQPQLFEQAAPLSQSRWHYTLGFALYQEGEHDRAEAAWQRALNLAEANRLGSMRLMTSLALARLLIDAQRLDDAERIVHVVQPQWGAGRTSQLIQLQQMRARLQLLRLQPARAYATLGEALALADASGLSDGEKASCLTDLAQVLIALEREDEAVDLLQRLSTEHPGRNGEVFACLRDLLQAVRVQVTDLETSRRCLAQGLAQAQRIRYMMFFRLLPTLAGRVCALALQEVIEPVFATEVVKARALPAPPEAGLTWPWVLRVRMIGAFDLQGLADAGPTGGKTQHKPLELLRMMACERTMALSMQVAMDALWPDAEGDAARKSLEMAVQRLRRLLSDATLVIVGDGRVALDARRVASDVAQRRLLIDRLDALAMDVVRVPNDRAGATCALLVSRVVELTRGELLPGAAATPWLQAERHRFRQETVRGALAAAAVMEHTGAHGEETALLETAHGIEPLSEAIAVRLMQAYGRGAQTADVCRVYVSLQRSLLLQGLRPSPDTERMRHRLAGHGAP
jgi:DNA-binding SARP family transcriptional activator